MIYSFKAGEDFILLDVESSSVHIIDELVFDVCQKLEAGHSNEQIIQTLAGKYEKKIVNEALEELEALKKQGMFNTKPNDYVAMKEQSVVKAMCLNVAHDCNLRCSYCFADTGEYHLGKALMPINVGKKALDFLMLHSGKRTNLEVDFFGGEPLLNFQVVKELVNYGRTLEKKHNKKIAFTMTTNALALNDEIIEFCNKELSNVVISIDGREEVHDRVRKTPNGSGSFAAILPKAKKLAMQRQNANQDYFIRGTFTKNNLDFSRDALFLADLGFEQISIEPVVLPSNDPLAFSKQDLEKINKEYEVLSKEYILRRNGENQKWFSFFHFNLDLENGPCIAKRMSGCGAGNEYIAVTPQGDIYPCHQFIGREAYIMGSVITGEFNGIMQQKFKNCNIDTKQDCKSCWAKYFCSGGCAANAQSFNGDIGKPYKMACDLERNRIEHALAIFAREKLLEN